MTLLDAFSLLGGVGLFLYGMTVMSAGLKDAAGDNLQAILEKATSNKITAVFVGMVMTILVQSSSATDIMVIGFVNSGMMTLFQALGVIMGANIGTTVTAQITAFNLAAYAPVIMFLGVVAFLFIKNNTVKYVGEVIMGFGMLFVGITIMKTAIAPLVPERSLYPSVFPDLDQSVPGGASLACLHGRCCRVPPPRRLSSRPLRYRDC